MSERTPEGYTPPQTYVHRITFFDKRPPGVGGGTIYLKQETIPPDTAEQAEAVQDLPTIQTLGHDAISPMLETSNDSSKEAHE